MKIHKELKDKLAKAVDYLKLNGCKEIILFGSLADGTFDEKSDIDLAISGLSPRKFFRAIVELMLIVDHKIDLVTLDYVSQEVEMRIREKGEVIFAS